MRVAIIDYGSGNLKSVAKAFERAVSDMGNAIHIDVTSDAKAVLSADHIVLPGVGAYADCRRGLDNVPGMLDALNDVVHHQARPFLGICVGMQLLSTRGLEKSVAAGLNWIEGDVREMKPSDPALKIPQIGWNTLDLHYDHPVFTDIATGDHGLHAYFVHSYKFDVQNASDVLATTSYGETVTAAVARGNIVGTQFHPEKSQRLGLKFITNFLKWKP